MGRRPAAGGRCGVPPTAAAARLVVAARPLGGTLEFLRALWGVNHGLESASRRMKGRLGISGPERMVVRLVGRYPGISSGDLAWLLQVHPSTLTGLMKRLVERGVLVRGTDAGDGRRALFSLTGRGRSLDGVEDGTVEAAVVVLEALKRTLHRDGTRPPRRPA